MSGIGQPGRAVPGADRALWIAAANCGVLTLLIAGSMTGQQRVVLAASSGTLALSLVCVITVRGALQAARTGTLQRVLKGGLIALIAAGIVVLGSRAVGTRTVIHASVAFAGFVLVLRWVASAMRAAEQDATPWQYLAAGVDRAPQPPARDVAGAVCGAMLLLGSAIIAGRQALISSSGDPDGFLGGVVIVAALTALAFGPLAVVTRIRARRAWIERERGRQRQEVAAHLHDSVLQTLALIQRSSGDPERVQRLARQQERGLRAWLAGVQEEPADSVGAALRAGAAEVEDESAGATSIEVIVIADAPLTAGAVELVAAAREAMRNAAQHGGGTVGVVVDPDPVTGELVVFIRDHGPGFGLDDVPAARRGVRDAIIGRMEHAFGSARIESSDAGTEVTLRLPLDGQAGS